MTNSLPIISNVQSNMSPGERQNCLTILIGTVVLRDVFFVAASDNFVVSPKSILI